MFFTQIVTFRDITVKTLKTPLPSEESDDVLILNKETDIVVSVESNTSQIYNIQLLLHTSTASFRPLP